MNLIFEFSFAESSNCTADATAVDVVRVTHTFTALESAVQRNGKLTIVTITSWPHLINHYKAVAVDASAKTFYTILYGSGFSPATIEQEDNLTLLSGKRASQFTGTRDIKLIAKASSALQRKLGEIKPYLAPSNGHGQLTNTV